jgi:cytidylate kinase
MGFDPSSGMDAKMPLFVYRFDPACYAAPMPAYKPPCLLIVFGPPAVGKTSVALRIAERTDFKVLYNHLTIDLLLRFFDYGSPPFETLNEQYRLLLLTEAARLNQDLVITLGWQLDVASDNEIVSRYTEIYAGGSTLFVELSAGLETRLRRNLTEERRTLKKVEWATEERLRAMDQAHQYNTMSDFPFRDRLISINNEDLAAEEVADIVIRRFSLPSRAPS